MLEKISSKYLEEIVQISSSRLKDGWSYLELKKSVNQNRGFVFLDDKNNVQGFILTSDNVDFYEILELAVKIDGQGVGQALMREAVNDAKLLGIKKLTLEVSNLNYRAKTFYEKLGFKIERIRKKYYKDGSDALNLFLIID